MTPAHSDPSAPRIRKWTTTPLVYALGMALVFLGLNYPFIDALIKSQGGLTISNAWDTFTLLVALYALLFLLISLTAWKWVTKPIGYFLLLTAVPAAGAIANYGTEFTPLILRSVFSTDFAEATGFFSVRFAIEFLLLAALPCLLLSRVRIVFPPIGRLIVQKMIAVVAVLLVAIALYLPNQLLFNAFADNAANYRLKSMILPFNYLGALRGYVREELEARRPAEQRAEGDAAPTNAAAAAAVYTRTLPASGKRTVLILLLGESARARSFSLNGYSRETNPRLRNEGVISLSHVEACATATAQSVPCLFSSLGEKNFSYRRARETDNLLDVAKHAGYQVTWYENGMGTQSVTRSATVVKLGSYYHAERDRVLIDSLPSEEELVRSDKDQLIILHQRGSHGPDYAERYSAEFRRFAPDCDSSVLKSCSHDAVVNAYDNTILYTDANIADAIEYLKRLDDRFNTALLYVSDHGESTGEQGWYMHGLPKMIAPEDQTRVPLILWVSPGLEAAQKIDIECVRRRKDEPYSHDNVFHTTVGLLEIRTPDYKGALDVFHACRAATTPVPNGRATDP